MIPHRCLEVRASSGAPLQSAPPHVIGVVSFETIGERGQVLLACGGIDLVVLEKLLGTEPVLMPFGMG